MHRENNINLISFVAALMVILGHMCHLIGIPPVQFMGQAVSTIAVKVFFLISGCLTATSYLHDNNLSNYYIKRIFRIVPGYVAVILITIFIVGPLVSSLNLSDYFYNPQTWNYLKNIVFNIQYALPGVFMDNPYPNAVNGSLWTLPVQMGLYLVLPLILTLFRKNVVKCSFFLAVVIETANILLERFFPSFRIVIWGTEIVSALSITSYFFLGVVFISEEIKEKLNMQLASGLLVVICILNLTAVKTELLVFIILPYFIFSLAYAKPAFFRKCFSKNDISYGIYLYSFLVQQVVVLAFREYTLSLNVLFAISTVISIVFGYLSWFCIEKPFQKWGKYIIALKKENKG